MLKVGWDGDESFDSYLDRNMSLLDALRPLRLDSPADFTHPRDYHLTLQFIGRDLHVDQVAGVITASLKGLSKKPLSIEFDGTTRINKTSKGEYLVATVKPTDGLLEQRKILADELARQAVKITDSFLFAPHVTLAEGPVGSMKGVAPFKFESYSVQCREAIVKYGKFKMSVMLVE